MPQQYRRIEEYIFRQYGAAPEYLWKVFPDYAVFRHQNNRKWFALLMNIAPDKLVNRDSAPQVRLPEKIIDKEKIYVLDLKMPQTEIPAIYETVGIYPGYPRSAGNWISVILEDIMNDEFIIRLIAKSYSVTSDK